MMPISLADLPQRYQAQAMEKLRAQQTAREIQKKTAAKYHNEPDQVNGIRFDSRKEARRYRELMEYQDLGMIRDLRLQVDFTLQEAYTKPDGTRVRAIRYRADFTYVLTDTMKTWASDRDREFWSSGFPGQTVVEDVKGVRTDVFKMKKKLMENLGYEIREV